MNLVIFEGPDGSGKTTAAKAYAENTDARYRHWGEVSDPFAEYVSFLADEIPKDGVLVLDRFYHSELVYGPIIRGEERIGEKLWLLNSLCSACKGVLVLCMPPMQIIRQNVFDRTAKEDMDGVRERLDAICEAYVGALGDLPWFMYDYSEPAHGTEWLSDTINSTRHDHYTRYTL